MMKRLPIIALALSVMLIFLLSCSANTEQNQEPIKIGFVGPLTEEIASWGLNALAGAQLAVNEINNAGGINGRKVELIVEDDKCKQDSVNAITKLISVDKVVGIIGPICSSAAAPAMPIAQQYGVPTITPTASAPELTKIGEYIFRVYPSDSAQGVYAADFIFGKLQKKKVALIYVQNAWGEGLQQVFSKRFMELDGDVVYQAGVSQDEKDFKTELLKVKNSGADVLYFPVYPTNAVAAFKQMKEIKFDIQVVGGDVLDSDEVIKSGYADNVIFTVPDVLFPEEFKQRVKQVQLQGYQPFEVSFVSALGYDAGNVMLSAIEQAGDDKVKIQQALEHTLIEGVSSKIISFDDIGDLKNPQFKVKVIKGDKAVGYG
ncbi:ABC transporter substrate-binding protein [Candidatus Woesearchaeota archaeon]|nr:ABC transporter substrate-binding protein [Candidatus Woesearchaeota archaeon]